MSFDQATIKARNWTLLARTRHPELNYRVAEWGKANGTTQYAVLQYLGDTEVGIAAS